MFLKLFAWKLLLKHLSLNTLNERITEIDSKNGNNNNLSNANDVKPLVEKLITYILYFGSVSENVKSLLNVINVRRVFLMQSKWNKFINLGKDSNSWKFDEAPWNVWMAFFEFIVKSS